MSQYLTFTIPNKRHHPFLLYFPYRFLTFLFCQTNISTLVESVENVVLISRFLRFLFIWTRTCQCDPLSECMVGRPAAWTRGSLTGKFWQRSLLFPTHTLIIRTGRLPGPWILCSHELTHQHALRQKPTYRLKHCSSQCENFCEVSSLESHRCSSWHLSRLC